jgi:hypothetical protein
VINGHKRLLILIGGLVIRVFVALVGELISSGVIVGVVVIVSVVIGVHGVEVISVTISEAETVVCVGVLCHGMDTIFDGGWHGELGPMGAFKTFPSYETVEKISALL